MRSIAGMVVAITGASSGIGLALAEYLAAQGARLALCARRGDRLQALVQRMGGDHLALTADVSRSEECMRFVSAAHARFGRLDTLVCNAGYGIAKRIVEITPADWHAIFSTNLLGTTECIRAAVPLMAEQSERDGWRGQTVIVSSCLARRAPADIGAYAATKAAQLSVAEALRVELAPQRIAVTSVHPVGTETEINMAMEAVSGRILAPIPASEPQQSAALVAECIAAAIRRPRPEVWPHRRSRWLFALAGLAPGVADGVAAKHRRLPD